MIHHHLATANPLGRGFLTPEVDEGNEGFLHRNILKKRSVKGKYTASSFTYQKLHYDVF